MDVTKLVRMTCCGKGIHLKCWDKYNNSNMTNEQKSKCPHCRTKPPPEKEIIKNLRKWVKKGK